MSRAGVGMGMCVGMGVGMCRRLGTSRGPGVGAGVRVDQFAFACYTLTMAILTQAARGDG